MFFLFMFCVKGFLEDQNLTETSRVFLSECPHLDECRLYAQRGIQFPKTIHGKTLVGHLNQACNGYIFCRKKKLSS